MNPRTNESASSQPERRRQPRVRAFCAVELSSAEKRGRCGITRDASGLGLRIVTPSRFAAGESLEVSVHMSGIEKRVRGRVVRVEDNPWDSNEPWRYKMSVVLEEPLSDDMLAGAAEQAARLERRAS